MTLDILSKYLPEDIELPNGYFSPMPSLLINALIKHGYDVVAFTTSSDIVKPISIEGKHLTLCIARREPHAGRDFFYSERKDLVSLMNEYPVDILNAQWSYEFAWAALEINKNAIVTLRDHAFTIFRYSLDAYRAMKLIMNHRTLDRAKHIIANSEYLYNRLGKRIQEKTKIISNFFNSTLMDKKGIAKKENYILTVANGFGNLKNIKNSLQAFSLIREKIKNIEYHLVGYGMETFGEAYAYAKSNNLVEGIKFLGFIPYNEVIGKIKKAKILLHSSLEESFGMVVLESMVLGTPVIGGNKSGNVPYLLKRGELGILCNVKEPKQIAQSILSLLNDNEHYDYILRAARTFAEEEFNEEKQINKLINYYNTIVS